MTTRVSVCMISFRHAAFVEQSLRSVLAQQTPFAYDVVIGDDHSDDGTLQICEGVALEDPRLRVLGSPRNLGVFENLSRVLRECRGDYIAICEGDDYWTDRGKLARQVALLDAEPALGGCAHQSTVTVNGHETGPFRLGVPTEIRTEQLLAGRLFHTASLMFRREALAAFLGAPPVLSCDRLLNLCVSFVGPIRFQSEAMCVYRRHVGGMSSMVTPTELRRDLASVPYLKSLRPDFPAARYSSYVHATIGLTPSATPGQRAYHLAAAGLLSFADFPRNLRFVRAALRRLRP